jgi:hypothetical protein
MQDTHVNERERARIPDKYKWDLSAIYADDNAWEIAKQQRPFGAEIGVSRQKLTTYRKLSTRVSEKWHLFLL